MEDAKVVLKSVGLKDGRKATLQAQKIDRSLKGDSRDIAKERSETKELVRVRDLCQVVPRGRTLVLMVGEKEVRISFRISSILP